VKVVAISVDPPEVSAKWAADKGFTFTLLSDPEARVIKEWGMLNVDNDELALHGVFLVDEGTIRYRKVAGRRVGTKELLHAIDGDPVMCCAWGCGDQAVCRPIPAAGG
jgi:peroxiredoxin